MTAAGAVVGMVPARVVGVVSPDLITVVAPCHDLLAMNVWLGTEDGFGEEGAGYENSQCIGEVKLRAIIA